MISSILDKIVYLGRYPNHKNPDVIGQISESGVITRGEAIFGWDKNITYGVFLDYCAAAKRLRLRLRLDDDAEPVEFAFFSKKLEKFLNQWKSKSPETLARVISSLAGGDFKLTYVDLTRMSAQDEKLVMKTWVDICRAEALHPLLPITRPDVFGLVSIPDDKGLHEFYSTYDEWIKKYSLIEKLTFAGFGKQEFYTSLSNVNFAGFIDHRPQFTGTPLPLRHAGTPIGCLSAESLIQSGLCLPVEIDSYKDISNDFQKFKTFLHRSREDREQVGRVDVYDYMKASM